MIDILVIIAAIMAFYTGYRRGFIVQLISLVGLYIAILLAPTIAEPVGSIFIDNSSLAYVAGFFLVLCVAMLIMWFVAPIIGKLIFWNPFKRLDALMGGVLNLVVVIVVASALFAAFDYANIDTSKPDQESITNLTNESIASGKVNLVEQMQGLANGDIETLRKFFKPRFVDYETLESSATFDLLANFGRLITPSLEGFNDMMRAEAKSSIDKNTLLLY